MFYDTHRILKLAIAYTFLVVGNAILVIDFLRYITQTGIGFHRKFDTFSFFETQNIILGKGRILTMSIKKRINRFHLFINNVNKSSWETLVVHLLKFSIHGTALKR